MDYKYLLDDIIEYSNEESDCKLHEGTFLAYNEKTGDMQWNQWIFENNHDSILFWNALGDEMKAVFEDKFKQYKATLSKMTEVSVEAISKTLENTIYSHFKVIQDEIFGVVI